MLYYEGVKHWNKWPREAVGASSLEMGKARLDGVLLVPCSNQLS